MADWKRSRYRAMVLTTRPFQLADDEHMTRFAPEALEGMLAQVRSKFLPANVEHLTFLPPHGRWVDGEILNADDGEQELILEGVELAQYTPAGRDPAPLEEVKAWESGNIGRITCRMQLEMRNFEPADAEDITKACPLSVRPENKWSVLPPLEWTLWILVTWGLAKYAGAFLQELGRSNAQSLVNWVADAGKRARESQREQMFTVMFDLNDSRYIHAIVPFVSDTAQVRLTSALGSLDDIASFAASAQQKAGKYAGLQRATFLYDESGWHFAWWTDGNGVYLTNWFVKHCPDPARFLGRPLFGRDDDASA
jgi:hypothetical protein